MAGFSPRQMRRMAAIEETPDADLKDIIRVDLIGVRTEVSSRLSQGQILSVTIHEFGTARSVVCRTEAGEIVGTLAGFRGLAQMLRSLDDGTSFSAIVESVSASHCSVQVRRR